ncbi:sensor histidine kinase [Methylocapsa sp. S129]|uniref:sensor histidine kinase n=1 Tax=Methylocapsa sp. S129 TaxID=1641869 RepID=UPI001FEE3966|nr:histidine kinase dimerization/phosphoacceptor domain -containing protein [Methylocapsa sp. S129]
MDTVREPLLVLDGDLSVLAASRSFYLNFHVGAGDVLGRSIFDLVDAQFNIPTLRPRLKAVVTTHAVMDRFEIEAIFPTIGNRTLILDAREVFDEGEGRKTILLAFEDVTDRRAIEDEKAALLKQTEDLLLQKDVLLQEIQHRVANSLQIIASILMMKARLVTSAEIREHLEDAHRRVMSVATVQEHISAAGRAHMIEIRPYLVSLCESLAASMIGDRAAIALKVHSDDSTVLSAYAVSLGLIVTELVINVLKHAFPKDHPNAEVLISYEASGDDWRLVVSDNGVGKPAESVPPRKNGLGTSLVSALAQQLEARVEAISSPNGLKVSITRASLNSLLPQAA